MRRHKSSIINTWAILTILGLAAVFAFYGCQALQPKNEAFDIDEQPLDRRIGSIRSLGGVKTSSQGTHLLQLDDGNTILLKSLQINLDDPQYAGKTVEVRGLLTYTTDGKQIMEVMNIDIIQGEVSQTAEQPLWKDYASSELGFSVKYRDDFEVDDEAKESVSFSREVLSKPSTQETEQTTPESSPYVPSKPVLHLFSVQRSQLASSETLLQSLGVKSDSASDLLAAGMSKSKIGAQSLDAIKKSDGTVVQYYFQSGTWRYSIEIDSGSDEKTLEDQNLFYEMLSTFRIMNDEESASAEADVLNNLEIGNTQENDTSPEVEAAHEDDGNTDNDGSDTADQPETAPETQETTPETQEAIEGFSTLESETFKFAVQYPKSWYYEGSSSSESGVVRHYGFGSKPLDEEPGSISFDVMSGSMPSGSTMTVNGKTVTKVTSGSSVEFYVQGSGSRVYRISGPSGQDSVLLQMAGSVEG